MNKMFRALVTAGVISTARFMHPRMSVQAYLDAGGELRAWSHR